MRSGSLCSRVTNLLPPQLPSACHSPSESSASLSFLLPKPPSASSAWTNSSLSSPTGYGFVDFDSPAAAQKAVSSLKATGVQAQMAKVGRV